nr:immunoglobulin heavy chain junction region [Mus musculus]
CTRGGAQTTGGFAYW